MIDGDVGQAMPRPCSSPYVGDRRSRLRARAGDGDARSSIGSDEATETKRRCAAGAGSAYATATRADKESGGPNQVDEDEDYISPSESDDVFEPSIGGSEEPMAHSGKTNWQFPRRVFGKKFGRPMAAPI